MIVRETSCFVTGTVTKRGAGSRTKKKAAAPATAVAIRMTRRRMDALLEWGKVVDPADWTPDPPGRVASRGTRKIFASGSPPVYEGASAAAPVSSRAPPAEARPWR